jgi:hypothetical protein
MIGELMSTNKELVPKCLNTEEEICLNAAGYFTPCCWFDTEEAPAEHPLIAGFFNPDLNIDKHENLENIIEGAHWQKFIVILKNEPQDAPKRCWDHCSADRITTKHLPNDNLRILF